VYKIQYHVEFSVPFSSRLILILSSQYTTVSSSCFPIKTLFEFELHKIFITSVYSFISTPAELLTWDQTGI